MQLILAPMEGVVDHLMRQLLTEIGGFDLCITEFLRVVDRVHPRRSFIKLCPELLTAGKTASGVPVRLQLLGQSPEWMAENAAKAVALGSPGVDLNFGCPAKTVNKTKGGAVLLQQPEALYQIVSAVRKAVPSQLPVSAKMRLGYNDRSLLLENAQAIASAGADLLTIHARTRQDGYRPPAYWDAIKQVKQSVAIPLVANGDIWSATDAARCRVESGCDDLMLGRGALAMPNLAVSIRDQQAMMPWPQVLQLLRHYADFEIRGDKGLYFPNRIKQWLVYLKLIYPEAEQLFRQIRTLKQTEAILTQLAPAKTFDRLGR